jgi:hypothetical protein
MAPSEIEKETAHRVKELELWEHQPLQELCPTVGKRKTKKTFG